MHVTNSPAPDSPKQSLLPLTPEVTGVTTSGLYWELDDAALRFGSTLSVSNEMMSDSAEIVLRSGILLIVHLLQEAP